MYVRPMRHVTPTSTRRTLNSILLSYFGYHDHFAQIIDILILHTQKINLCCNLVSYRYLELMEETRIGRILSGGFKS